MNVNQFADMVLAQRKARIAREYSQWQADAEVVSVKPGRVYTKVDIGPKHNMSGAFLVEVLTGVIYGIKGYGMVHKGRCYGTLATTDEWDWSGYRPVRSGTEDPEEYRGVQTDGR